MFTALSPRLGIDAEALMRFDDDGGSPVLYLRSGGWGLNDGDGDGRSSLPALRSAESSTR